MVVHLAAEFGGSDEIALSHEEASRFLRLRYAVCYFTIQGRTLRDQHILLLDGRSRHFTVRNLIVGLSRVTAGLFAHVATRQQEKEFLEALG